MQITWRGGSSVELKLGKNKALLNPGKKATSADAQVVIYDRTDEAHEDLKEGLMVNWPGEYDVAGFSFRGIETHGKESTIAYVFHGESGSVAWMSEMSEYPSKEFIEDLGEVHVLIVPVGGKDVLNGKDAFRLVEALEPMVVIPICYGDKRDDLTAFLKEMDVKKPSPEKNFTFKRSALSQDNLDLVLLEA